METNKSWEKDIPRLCLVHKVSIPKVCDKCAYESKIKVYINKVFQESTLQAQTEEKRRIAEKVIEMWNYPCKCAEKQQICYHNFSIMHSIINLINK